MITAVYCADLALSQLADISRIGGDLKGLQVGIVASALIHLFGRAGDTLLSRVDVQLFDACVCGNRLKALCFQSTNCAD